MRAQQKNVKGKFPMTAGRAAPRLAALAVLRTAKMLPYSVRLSISGQQDCYRHDFDRISHYSAGRCGPQDRYPSPARPTVAS